MAASTATAQAAPKGIDVHRAVVAADASLATSVTSANAGQLDAAGAQIARTRTLEARAVRVARKVAASGSAGSAALQLRRAGGAVDRGFNAYAALLPSAPPELRGSLVGALSQFDAFRSDLGGQLATLVDVLPPDIRDQVTAAITAFQSNGDLSALIAALGDPATVAAIRAHLGELVDQVVATLQAQINDPETVAGLAPGSLEQIQAVILVIQVNREAVITTLSQILDDGGMNIPTLSDDMCVQVKLVFGQLGIPLPDGICSAA
jgi:hypothetical protein